MPKIYHESTTSLYIVNPNPYGYKVAVHASCICNELKALTNRHLVDRTDIGFDKKAWERNARLSMKFFPKDLKPVTYKEVLDAYNGPKKRMYKDAAASLQLHGYKEQYAHVSMFIKPDKLPKQACEEKDPRGIQFRSPHFNLELSRYIKAYEHEFYSTCSAGTISGTRVVAKGLNNYQRAELLMRKVNSFKRPIYLMVDHSRFDSTVNETHLKTCHKKYQRAFRSKRLQHFLNCQLTNTCFSKGGIRYRSNATRMSGDSDTGCGNTEIAIDAILMFLRECDITVYDFILDGDDAVIILEEHDLQKIQLHQFARAGFRTKVEITSNLHEVDFCQCRIIPSIPLMVRNPERALSNMMVSLRRYDDYTPWVASVGACEAAINAGAPILGPIGFKLSQLTDERVVDPDLQFKMANGGRKYKPPDIQARLEYEEAWGVDVQTQLDMEATFNTSLSFKTLKYKQARKLSNSALKQYRQYADAAILRASQAFESLAECSGSSWWSSCPAGPKLPYQQGNAGSNS
nr:MAG: RNA-dependent RNA polymerase [Riboviria sp.]